MSDYHGLSISPGPFITHGLPCTESIYQHPKHGSTWYSPKNKCMFTLIAAAKVVTGTILMMVKVVVEGCPLCIYMHHMCMSDSVLNGLPPCMRRCECILLLDLVFPIGRREG